MEKDTNGGIPEKTRVAVDATNAADMVDVIIA